jgi:hypothetical protein
MLKTAHRGMIINQILTDKAKIPKSEYPIWLMFSGYQIFYEENITLSIWID